MKTCIEYVKYDMLVVACLSQLILVEEYPHSIEHFLDQNCICPCEQVDVIKIFGPFPYKRNIVRVKHVKENFQYLQ